MTDLRETLAHRFWKIDPRRWPNKPDLIFGGFAGTSVDGAPGLTYGAMADECIRQMDWAARNAFDSCCNRGPLPQDLTPAPDDWRPE